MLNLNSIRASKQVMGDIWKIENSQNHAIQLTFQIQTCDYVNFQVHI